MASTLHTDHPPITEGWLWWRMTEEAKKSKTSVKIKKYFYTICCGRLVAVVSLYKKAPKSKSEKPSVTHTFHEFQLRKINNTSNEKRYSCEIMDRNCDKFNYGFDEENHLDAFAFFLVTQLHLPIQLPSGKAFGVIPDDTDSQRRIGSRGSRCILHICISGLTLAFKISQAIIAQWPLNSIRNYEASGQGHFQMEAGRRSPMGEGVYGFRTSKGDDSELYSLFDKYVQETLNDKNYCSKDRDGQIYSEYCSLQQLVTGMGHLSCPEHLVKASIANFNITPSPSCQEILQRARSLTYVDDEFHSTSDHKLPDLEYINEQKDSLKAESISRQRSRTAEDPVALPTYGVRRNQYLDMNGSSPSLNMFSAAKRLHMPLPLAPTFTGSAAKDFHSPSTAARSPASSMCSSTFSPLSLATPPPNFFDAVEMPSYPAPTPPDDRRSLSGRTSAHTFSPGNKEFPDSITPSRSIDDLNEPHTPLNTSTDFWSSYENAMFRNDILNQMESSNEFTEKSPYLLMSENQVKSYATENDCYCLAEERTVSASDPDSVRVASTYLFPKGDSTTDSETPKIKKQDQPTDCSANLVQPYMTTVIDDSVASYTIKDNNIPPQVPVAPRPLHLKRILHSASTTTNPFSHSDTLRLTAGTSAKPQSLVIDAVTDGIKRNGTDCYEMIADSDTLTRDTSVTMADLYEHITEKEMLGNRKEKLRERSTIWHISLDGEVIDNPLPSDSDDPAGHTPSDFLDSFQGSSVEKDLFPNIEDPDAYLLPNVSSPSQVLLPLPRENDSSSDEEKRWIGLGSLTRMISGFSKSRTRKSRPSDSTAVNEEGTKADVTKNLDSKTKSIKK